MENFDFYNPTRIAFGEGQIAKLAELIPAGSKVLMTYGGGSIKKNGVYDQVMAATQAFELHEFGGIEPNPTYQTLMQAVALIKEKHIDFILAVGGGSVIDGTKFIAAAAKFAGGDPWQLMAKGLPIKAALPFGTVLTLPATGSEMNMGFVISNTDTGDKLANGAPCCYPAFSVLDPTVTKTLPPRQLGNGVVDAFTHVVEQYVTVQTGAMLQQRFSEAVLLTLKDLGARVMNEPDNYDIRANFMWCTTWALNGLLRCGAKQDWATHMIGHELTVAYGLDHAQTLAVILPALWTYKADKKQKMLLQYGERVWGITTGDDKERVKQAIEKTRAFFESVGVKTRLSGYGITLDDALDKVVSHLNKLNRYPYGEHKDIYAEDVKAILKLAA